MTGPASPKRSRRIDRSIILGDDLIVTNRDRLQRAVKIQPLRVHPEAQSGRDHRRSTGLLRIRRAERYSGDSVGPIGRRHRRCRDGPGGGTGGTVSEKRRAAVGRAHREAQLPAARGRRHPGLCAGGRAGIGAVLSASRVSGQPPTPALPPRRPRTPPTTIESATQSAGFGRDGAAEI